MSWLKRVFGGGPKDGAIFAVVDLETTGFNAGADRIIEMAAIRAVPGGPSHPTFQALINPGISIPPRATAVHGITDADVVNGERIEDALPQFLEFVDDLPLVIYNAPFDMRFLHSAAGSLNLEIGNPVIDVLPLAREAFPDFENHKLATVCSELGIDRQPTHRALDDCAALLMVYDAIVTAT